MILASKEKVEYRRTNEVEGKNGVYFLHTFEDSDSSFQLYCKTNVTCKKGDLVNLVFETRLYDGKMQFNLKGIE